MLIMATKSRPYLLFIPVLFICCSCNKVQVNPTTHPSNSGIRFYGSDNGNILQSFGPTADGGYYFGGSTNTSAGMAGQGWIQKTDKNGNGLWYKEYGGPNQDVFNAVHPTTDGGFIAVGATNSYGQGITRKDYYPDAWLLKTDANGCFKWQVLFGNIYYDNFVDVAETPDHGYVAVGYTGDPVYNNCVHIVKTDATGKLLWSKELYQGFFSSSCSSVCIGTNGD